MRLIKRIDVLLAASFCCEEVTRETRRRDLDEELWIGHGLFKPPFPLMIIRYVLVVYLFVHQCFECILVREISVPFE